MKNLVFFYTTLLLFLVWMSACGGGETKTEDIDYNNPEIVIEQNDAKPAQKDQVTSILDESGSEVIHIEINPTETIIKYNRGQDMLNGRSKSADKSKYYNQKGDLVAEVKYKDDAFKLRDSNSNLLWKVKIKEGKIKISDNEEGESAFEIKQNETGKFKVKLGEEQLTEAKLKDGFVTVTGKGIYRLKAKENHPAYAVLSLGNLEETHRMIIVAELLKKI